MVPSNVFSSRKSLDNISGGTYHFPNTIRAVSPRDELRGTIRPRTTTFVSHNNTSRVCWVPSANPIVRRADVKLVPFFNKIAYKPGLAKLSVAPVSSTATPNNEATSIFIVGCDVEESCV
ncbi:hypothetical protein SFRURICE_016849 [Spodoptera frugiperda]|nr:hypothetical protein SFRURICE_016849 [Spodoptera frugiperda]